jgi:hypothetical protein
VIRVAGLLLTVFATLATGCASTTPPAVALGTRPVEEDPLALLPGGADLILDIDVTQLKGWSPARRFLTLLPPATQERIAHLGFDPLDDVEQLWAAVTQLGTPEAHATLILKGALDPARVRAGLGAPGEVKDTDWHGTQLSEGPAGAFARLTPKLFVTGSATDVRRAIDLRAGDGDSVRTSSSDRLLRAAFVRAPTAKLGRPAVMAAVIPPPALREDLKKQQLPGSQFDWLAASLAVGDGFDVGAIASVKGPLEAQQLVGEANTRKAEFANSFTVRLLGLKPYIDPIQVKAKESEVHFGYWLAAPQVEALLSRLESMQSVTRQKSGAKPSIDQ